MYSETAKRFSLFIIAVAFVGFLYLTVTALKVSSRTQVSTSEGIYTNHVRTSEAIAKKAFSLTESCQTELCRVQKILDYVTEIPYRINRFKAHSPQKTIQNNFGDCDDKSNLLISMLHALGIEAYFVLVPKHIFVIVPLEDAHLAGIKGLYVNGRKYYILESTAQGSPVGFPLHYKLSDISAIVEPFSNRKIEIEKLEYRL